MASHRRILVALCSVAFALVAASSHAAGRYEPRLRFRVLRTTHFTIYYHQGEAVLAGRLAAIAEDVRVDLERRTGLNAPSHAHVVLVDQSDVSNGWSTPVPYNVIEIAAVPPPPSSFIGCHDDWLRLVFTHEYAHLVHLDRVGGIMKGARWVLGRNPATFPNLFVPQWQVEGFATWAESAVTGRGRVNAADVAAVVALRTAGEGMPIDRAGGGLIAWPSGNTPYFFGGFFDEALAGRASAQRIGDLARETARRLPFLGGGAIPRVFGASAGDLWLKVFAARPGPPPLVVNQVTRLTQDGFVVSGPRLLHQPSRPAGTPDEIYYSAQSPHRFPDIRKVALRGGASRHVASRYGGNAVSSDGRWVFFDQLEFDGIDAMFADLYAHDLASGRTRRLTRGQRLTDPDVDRGGTRIVAIRARNGSKRVTVWRLGKAGDGSPVLAPDAERTMGAAGCEYASPRWAPDATRIAAVRQCIGSLPAIVEIGVLDGAERVVAAGSARNITPAWTPDGRAILFASDRQDRRFKLYAALPGEPAGPPYSPVLLLDAPGGVTWPDVSPDGRLVVFASQTADGYDVFTAPLPDLRDVIPAPPEPAAPAPEVAAASSSLVPVLQDAGRADAAAAAPYSPWGTLLPRAWSPVLTLRNGQAGIGAVAGASDVLGYHEYSLAATWRVSGQRADFEFDGPPVSWNVAYAYNRWRPSIVFSASRTLDTVATTVEDSRVVQTADEWARDIFAGVVIPWRRVRVTQSWLAGVDLGERQFAPGTGIPGRRRNSLRGGWSVNSSRQFGYSISPEDGVTVRLNVEQVAPDLGADGQAFTVAADGRAYLSGLGINHVVALRAAVASSRGDATMQRTFDLGATGATFRAFDMGSQSVGLLRGLASDERAGTAVLVANLDYRCPIVRVERGIRTWPVFLRDVHGAVFVDIGSAGDALDALPAAAISAGGELASRLTLGYSWDASLSAGAAWTHDPTRPDRPDRFAVYVRAGYAF